MTPSLQVTAPAGYSASLCARLIEAGSRPVCLPTVATVSLPGPAARESLDPHLERLGGFSHVLFTSRSGIAAVLDRLAALHGGDRAAGAARLEAFCSPQGGRGRIYALGNDVGLLREAGVAGALSPPEASTAGLVRHLAGLGELGGGTRVLCPVPRVAGGLVEPAVVPRVSESIPACRLRWPRGPLAEIPHTVYRTH